MNNIAAELFSSTMRWLRDHYADYTFFQQRDIVWTVQLQLIQEVASRQLPLQVYHGYPVLPAKRSSICADLALVDGRGHVKLAVEFKYEPSHERKDILKSKLPVVPWGSDGVGRDVERVGEFVQQGAVEAACSVFIDEDGYFRQREPHAGSRWIDWGQAGRYWPSVLWAEAHCTDDEVVGLSQRR